MANELVTTDNFELNAEIVAGSLTSNAKELRIRVENELKNYSVERYIDNPALAKSDKALLTKVKETVATKRKEISAKWNEPLNEFLDEMKGLEKSISDAYDGLNKIVKEAENAEKDNKKKEIENYWKTLGDQAVTLEKIFNPKWLNKTFKMSDVMLEVESKIEKITTELATIRSMNDEDSEVLQSFYLETLDLNATLAKGNELKANKERIKALEASKTAEIIKNEFNGEIIQKPKEIAENSPKIEQIQPKFVENPTNLVTFTLKLEGTREQLWLLRQFIDAHKIKWEKIL